MTETFRELEILKAVLRKEFTLAQMLVGQMTKREMIELAEAADHIRDLVDREIESMNQEVQI